MRLESLVLRTPEVATFAASGMLSVELEALLPIDRPPLAAPPDVGVNVTVKVALWPAASARGRGRPVMVKPGPVRLACATVRLEPPELVRVPEIVRGVPTCTLPKFKLAGVEVRDPAVTALAASGTASVPSVASLENDTVPLAEPPDTGLKVTLKPVLWPGAKATGRLNPPIVNPDPETFACDTFTVDPPELVSAADKV